MVKKTAKARRKVRSGNLASVKRLAYLSITGPHKARPRQLVAPMVLSR